MTADDIYELAARYVDEDEFIQIPNDGEIFAMLQRDLPDNKVLKDDEGWKFAGYAKCEGYVADMESKPAGKWIYMTYLSLASFPPQLIEMKLQPPHIARGTFQNPSRDKETRIVTLGLDDAPTIDTQTPKEPTILKFPGKK